MTRFNSLRDIHQMIESQPIDTRFYVDDYVQIVADEYRKLIQSKGFSWGDDERDIEISEAEFWDLWKIAEKGE